MRINGRDFVGRNVIIRGSRISVDGVDVTVESGLSGSIQTVRIEGPVGSLDTDANVNCDQVMGNITAGGNVNCDKVGGSITAGGNVNCDDVKGNITAAIVNRG